VGRRALARLGEAAKKDAHELGDGSFTYGGKVYTGAEADYLRAATGAAKSHGQGPSQNLTPDESVELLSHQMAKMGISFEVWTRWTLDQLDLFICGRRMHGEFLRDQISMIQASANANQADSRIRYSIPLE
jgi:hypothetical protein